MRVPSLVLLMATLFGCVSSQPYTGSEQSARELLLGQWILKGESTTITFSSDGSGSLETYIESGHVTLDSEFIWKVKGNKLSTKPSLECPDNRARGMYIIHETNGPNVVIKGSNSRRVLTLVSKDI